MLFGVVVCVLFVCNLPRHHTSFGQCWVVSNSHCTWCVPWRGLGTGVVCAGLQAEGVVCLAWFGHWCGVQAYKLKALEHHPDKGGDEAMFLAVQAAYKALSSPASQSSPGATDPDGAFR
jgi:hypothetical protein